MEQVTNVLPGARELIKQSVLTYKKNYKILMSIGLVPVVFYIINSLVTIVLNQNLPETPVNMIIIGLVTILFALLSFVVQALFYISLINAAYEVDKGNTLSLKDIYTKSSKLFFPYIWMSILLTLSIIIPTLLFIIPGIIFYLYLSFSVFALVVDGKRGLQSLSTSYYYAKDNLGKIFWRFFVVILIAIGLSVILFIVAIVLFMLFEQSYDVNVLVPKLIIYFGSSNFAGMFAIAIWTFITSSIFAPIMSIYGYLIYKNIKLLKPEPNQETDLKSIQSTFKVVIIVGLIAIILFIGLIFALGVADGFNKASRKDSFGSRQFAGSSLQSRFPVNSIALSSNLGSLEKESFVSKELGFSINFPRNWQYEVSDDAISIYPDESQNLMADIMISKKVLAPTTSIFSTEDFMNQVVDGLLSSASSSLSNVNYQKYNVSGQDVYMVAGTFTADKVDININYYFIRNGTNTYTLITRVVSVPPAVASPVLTDSIGTFKIIK